MTKENLALHVLIYYSQGDGAWLARCLDLDVMGDGETAEAAVNCLRGAVDTHIGYAREHNLPLFRRAPEEYWRQYYQAAEKRLRQIEIPPDEPRSYALAV